MRGRRLCVLGIALVAACTNRDAGLTDFTADGATSPFGTGAGPAVDGPAQTIDAGTGTGADAATMADTAAGDASTPPQVDGGADSLIPIGGLPPPPDAARSDGPSPSPDGPALAPDAAAPALDLAPIAPDLAPPAPDVAPPPPDAAPPAPDAAPDAMSVVVDAGGASFEIRVASTTIPADGYSKTPVLVIGHNADGSPSTAKVVLNVSRPGVGSFDSPALTLRALGAQTYFVPCSSTTPGCLGTFRMTLALADAPNQPVATTGDLTLVAPVGVGNPAPCLVGGNVIFFDGNDYIYTGTETITQGVWSSSGSDRYLTVHVDPSDRSQGLWWDLTFSTMALDQSMREQVYTDAERAAFASPGHPGIDIGGDGRGCNTITGKFQVEDIQWDNNKLLSFTATFEQHCEGGPSALRGCVHYEAP